MINIGKHGKIKFHWKVSPYDYSSDKVKEIISKASKKYSIPKDRIKVIPDFKVLNEDGKDVSITTDIINNIQNPEFQIKLFQDYIKLNKIMDLDFDLVKKIDAEINAQIDYQVYDKYRRYSIKWIKWDNFLSYGQDNYFDFTNLSNLVLLNGAPANQSGKTTFAVDLLHFLLFGKTTKVATQDKIFNKHIPESTHVTVEGCLEIDGSEFIIKRTLSRPALEKRTSKSKTTQKVEYYKIVGDTQEELVEYINNYQEENSIQTNKAIKDAIGNESDFDLILSITESNLDDLIEKKESERGRLLSRWIGLLPIEEKNTLAREKYNSEVKPYFISNRLSIDELENENKTIHLNATALIDQNKKLTEEVETIDKNIITLEQTKTTLTSSKRNVDNNLLQIDITTLQRKIDDLVSSGTTLGNKQKNATETLEKLGTVEFSVEEFDAATERLNGFKEQRLQISMEYKTLQQKINDLTKSEFCPTCGRKYENIDNSKQIAESQKQLEVIIEQGKNNSKLLQEYEVLVQKLKQKRDDYSKYSALLMEKSALDLQLANLRNEYKDCLSIKKEYEKNKEIIDINNNLDIQIRNIEVQLNDKRNTRDNNLRLISNNEARIAEYRKNYQSNKEYIKKIEEEIILIRAWKIYLEMVGKDGISKMVLKKTLPIINARLSQMLSDICDFDVEIVITDKNDVMFYIIKDGIKSDLSSGSGFEKTASALALRAVLSDISTLPKLSGMVMDELWGRVAKENYDNMRQLVEKISEDYQWIIIITHLEDMKEWCDSTITVSKQNNISSLKVAQNTHHTIK